jgi:hypothetical protein
MLESIFWIVNSIAIIVAAYFVFATVATILYIEGIINNKRIMDIIANILIALFLIFMVLLITVAIIAFYEGR